MPYFTSIKYYRPDYKVDYMSFTWFIQKEGFRILTFVITMYIYVRAITYSSFIIHFYKNFFFKKGNKLWHSFLQNMFQSSHSCLPLVSTRGKQPRNQGKCVETIKIIH